MSDAGCRALIARTPAALEDRWLEEFIREVYAAGRAAGMTKAAELAEAAATAYDDDQSARFVLGEHAAIIRALAEGKS